MAENKKKEKTTYVDDGRPLADMSGVDAGLGRFFRSDGPSTGSVRDRLGTFWAAFKMMLLPTLAFGGGLAVLYGILYLLFRFVAK